MAKHAEIIAKKHTDKKDDTEEELNSNVDNLKDVSGIPDFW
jgi:hypothetical protein